MVTRAEGAPLPDGRVDERDTMFARMARTPNTPAYDEYYGRRPELRGGDDRIRQTPGVLRPGGHFYDAAVAAEAAELFDAILCIEPDERVVAQWVAKLTASSDRDATVRKMVRSLGAVAVGCSAIAPVYAYSHKGRQDEDYGVEVRCEHSTAIVFLVEMDFATMQRAPEAEAIRESAQQYFDAAVIAHTVAAVLQRLGHGAKAHYDAHYDLILPPLAVAAGLGELGRNNILVADCYGSRVRIGAVGTDMDLRRDVPRQLGVDPFCEICKKCADNCPSHALTTGPKESVRGVAKWPTHVERCYGYWRWLGSDCGICMAVCPFSHRNSWFHTIVRALVRHIPRLHRTMLFFDDLVYGRAWRRIPRRGE